MFIYRQQNQCTVNQKKASHNNAFCQTLQLLLVLTIVILPVCTQVLQE